MSVEVSQNSITSSLTERSGARLTLVPDQRVEGPVEATPVTADGLIASAFAYRHEIKSNMTGGAHGLSSGLSFIDALHRVTTALTTAQLTDTTSLVRSGMPPKDVDRIERRVRSQVPRAKIEHEFVLDPSVESGTFVQMSVPRDPAEIDDEVNRNVAYRLLELTARESHPHEFVRPALNYAERPFMHDVGGSLD